MSKKQTHTHKHTRNGRVDTEEERKLCILNSWQQNRGDESVGLSPVLRQALQCSFTVDILLLGFRLESVACDSLFVLVWINCFVPNEWKRKKWCGFPSSCEFDVKIIGIRRKNFVSQENLSRIEKLYSLYTWYNQLRWFSWYDGWESPVAGPKWVFFLCRLERPLAGRWLVMLECSPLDSRLKDVSRLGFLPIWLRF